MAIRDPDYVDVEFPKIGITRRYDPTNYRLKYVVYVEIEEMMTQSEEISNAVIESLLEMAACVKRLSNPMNLSSQEYNRLRNKLNEYLDF